MFFIEKEVYQTLEGMHTGALHVSNKARSGGMIVHLITVVRIVGSIRNLIIVRGIFVHGVAWFRIL